jgi:hypothetical protein
MLTKQALLIVLIAFFQKTQGTTGDCFLRPECFYNSKLKGKYTSKNKEEKQRNQK